MKEKTKQNGSLNESERHLNSPNELTDSKIYRLNLYGLLNAALMTG